MQSRIRNMIFAFACCAVFACVITHILGGRIGIWGISQQSYLEGREYTTLAETLSKQAETGELQDSFESYTADHVPFRESVLLANAALQRQGISTAAAIVGYPAYPPFYSSKYVIDPQKEFIFRASEEAPDTNSKGFKAWIETVNSAAQKHPDIRFVCDHIVKTSQSVQNPTRNLVSYEAVDENWVQQEVLDRLDENIDRFVDPIASAEEIESEWFSTDAHWTLGRALDNYNKLAAKLGWKHENYEGAVPIETDWRGARARGSLLLDYTSTLWDIPRDFSEQTFYRLKKDGSTKKRKLGKREGYLFKGKPLTSTPLWDAYTGYFGAGSSMIENSADTDGRTCLILSDSYAHCLKRYIAQNYSKSYFLMPGNNNMDRTFEEYIQMFDPDDIVILMHPTKYKSIISKSPSFLGLEGASGDDAEE